MAAFWDVDEKATVVKTGLLGAEHRGRVHSAGQLTDARLEEIERRILEIERWRDAFCERYDQTTRDLWNGIGGR